MTVMLDRYPNRVAATPINPPETSPGLVEIGLPHILGFLRRQRAVIALCVAAFLALGFAYLVVAPALYKATSWVLIDTRKMQIFGQGDVFQESTVSNTTVETQVQILQSGKIAADVVDALDLTHDPDFMSSDWDPIGAITGRVRSLLSGTVDLVSALFVTPEEPPPSSAVDRTLSAGDRHLPEFSERRKGGVELRHHRRLHLDRSGDRGAHRQRDDQSLSRRSGELAGGLGSARQQVAAGAHPRAAGAGRRAGLVAAGEERHPRHP